MSFCSFRRIFHPTIEEQIKDLELLLKLHNDHIGHCSTCTYHEPSDAPGFVTDYGSCKERCNLFYTKILESSCAENYLPSFDCSHYNEDVDSKEKIESKIKKLKAQLEREE